MEDKEYRELDHSELNDEWLKNRLSLCQKPSGEDGIELAHNMNKNHSSLVCWGFDTFLNNITQPCKLLDIGCGGGATLQEIARRFPDSELFGIDYSEDMVNLSTEIMSGRANIIQGSVQNLPYEAAEFDTVTAVETVYFWPDLINSFREVLRVLKDNGRFIIIHEMYDDRENPKYQERNQRAVNLSSLQLFTPQELREVLLNSGFSKVTFEIIPDRNWITYLSEK